MFTYLREVFGQLLTDLSEDFTHVMVDRTLDVFAEIYDELIVPPTVLDLIIK